MATRTRSPPRCRIPSGSRDTWSADSGDDRPRRVRGRVGARDRGHQLRLAEHGATRDVRGGPPTRSSRCSSSLRTTPRRPGGWRGNGRRALHPPRHDRSNRGPARPRLPDPGPWNPPSGSVPWQGRSSPPDMPNACRNAHSPNRTPSSGCDDRARRTPNGAVRSARRGSGRCSPRRPSESASGTSRATSSMPIRLATMLGYTPEVRARNVSDSCTRRTPQVWKLYDELIAANASTSGPPNDLPEGRRSDLDPPHRVPHSRRGRESRIPDRRDRRHQRPAGGQSQLEYQAHHDALTGLANRTLLPATSTP